MKYEVRRGDTIKSIAKEFGITENKLVKENNGMTVVYVGEVIDIPNKKKEVKKEIKEEIKEEVEQTEE